MSRITLKFAADRSGYSLLETDFCFPGWEGPRVAVRGGLPFAGCGTFQWTRAVRAVSLLLVRQALLGRRRGRLTEAPGQAALSGYGGSLAASLDYALSKQPQWLHDMFGTTGRGDALAKRIIRRLNPERKRPGPVMVFVPSLDLQVEVLVDGAPVREIGGLREIAAALESGEARAAQDGPAWPAAVNS